MKSKRMYITADVLTLARIVPTVGLIICARMGVTNTLVALALFSVGELFDAFDGFLARSARKVEMKEFWGSPEPDRSFWVMMDQLMDVMLGLSVLVYVGECVNYIFGWGVLFVAVPSAIAVQLIRAWDLERRDTTSENKLSPGVYALVMARRYAYAILLSIEILVLILFSPLDSMAKYAIISAGILIGVILCVIKVDRLTQDKTPLTEILDRANLEKKDR